MQLFELDRLLRDMLAINTLPIEDSSLNGLQVGRTNQEIKSVAFAVDAALESFQRAVQSGADMLFVHHGILWNKQFRLTGDYYKRIKYLVENDLALYACHLPLDLHPELGNNIGIAEVLGLRNIQPFGRYHGLKIGYKGELPEAQSIDQISVKLSGTSPGVPGILPFGPAAITKVGIVSGGDPRAVYQAIDEKLDLFITGDQSHEIYHPCLEAGINVIFGGHYATETWGIQRVAKKLQAVSDLSVKIIDIPTGL